MDALGPRAALEPGVHWQIAPRESLRADIGPWLNSGPATLVKRGDCRAVYRIDLPDRAVYLKHDLRRGWRDWIRRWLRPNAAQREFTRALALHRRGVPAIEPLAFGRRERESFLVTSAVPSAMTLEIFVAEQLPTLAEPQRTRVTASLVEALARLCATAHRAGVVHRDLHAGNILVDTRFVDYPNMPPALRLADLPGVRLRRTLGWRASCDNLAMLSAQYLNTATTRIRWRFWQAYLRERPELKLEPRAAAVEVQQAAERHRRRILKRRERRCLADNRDFYGLRTPQGVAHAVREVPSEVLTKLIHHPMAMGKRLPLASGDVPVTIEMIESVPWWRRLGRLEPALVAWWNEHAELARGGNIARPLAVVIGKHGHSSYLFRESKAR